MEPSLLLFIAITSAAITGNTVLLSLIYKQMTRIGLTLSEKLEGYRQRLALAHETAQSVKAWAGTLEDISHQAVTVCGETRQTVLDFDRTVEVAQARYTEQLANVDRRLDQVVSDISAHAERVKSAVAEPAMKVGRIAAGVQAVLSFIAPRDQDE